MSDRLPGTDRIVLTGLRVHDVAGSADAVRVVARAGAR